MPFMNSSDQTLLFYKSWGTGQTRALRPRMEPGRRDVGVPDGAAPGRGPALRLLRRARLRSFRPARTWLRLRHSSGRPRGGYRASRPSRRDARRTLHGRRADTTVPSTSRVRSRLPDRARRCHRAVHAQDGGQPGRRRGRGCPGRDARVPAPGPRAVGRRHRVPLVRQRPSGRVRLHGADGLGGRPVREGEPPGGHRPVACGLRHR
jgi:hypothetical protein